jgi:hypothetical protein
MRICVVCLGIAVLSGLALAQSPVARDLHLRGDRFQPLTYDKLTAEQKALVEHLLAGERGGMNGPFNVTLRSPRWATSRKARRAVALSFVAAESFERDGDSDDRPLLERAIRVVGPQNALTAG